MGINEKAIGIPQWLKEEQRGVATLVETINAELQRNPNMSLAEFAKNLDKVFVEESFQRIHRFIQSQFEVDGV